MAPKVKTPKPSVKNKLAEKMKNWLNIVPVKKDDVLKRPAASVMKKPAAKHLERTPEDADGDGALVVAEEEEEHRDRLKVVQFQKNLSSFPEWIQKAWNQNKSRAEKTKIVNSVVVRDAKGKYKFDIANPQLEDLKHVQLFVWFCCFICLTFCCFWC